MTQSLRENQESRISSAHSSITCGYFNSTKRPQIIRISDTRYGFERVVFPEQKILFDAAPDVLLEIHTSEMVTAILTDKISCSDLRIETFGEQSR